MATFDGFFDNFLQGLTNAKGTLGDYSHASKLVRPNRFNYAPKVKFLYHTKFNINPAVVNSSLVFTPEKLEALGMLIKTIELPKFKISVDTVQQYNKKRQRQTKLEYDPITIKFHDDNADLTNSLWKSYYSHYYGDSLSDKLFVQNAPFNRTGMDVSQNSQFFTSIIIYQLTRGEYRSYMLMNPKIISWNHSDMNYNSSDPAESTMSISYESVIYGRGLISNIDTFAKTFYDKTKSTLSIYGGGTTSIFGEGGIIDGVGSILEDFGPNGQIGLGTLIKGTNVFRNVSKLSKEGIKEEGFNLIKNTLGAVGGAPVSGVANVLFPKTNKSQTPVTALPPLESYSSNVQNATKKFETKFASDSTSYANAVTSIAKNANISGIPNNVIDFKALSSSQKTASTAKVMNEYENGNIKVVNMVNKYIS